MKVSTVISSINLTLIILLSTYINGITFNINTTVSNNFTLEIIEKQKKPKDTSSYNLSLLFPNEYHNLSTIYKELEYFNKSAPGLIDYSSLGFSYNGNKIPLIKLTNEQILDDKKGKTYLVAHHHAREMCTIENTIRLIRDLVNSYNIDNNINDLLDHVIIYFIVTLNPDSLDYTLYQNQHFRKTMKPYDDDQDGKLDEDGPEDLNNDGTISEYYVYSKLNTDIIGHWFEGWDRDGDSLIGEDPPGGVDLNRNYPFHWNDKSCDSGATNDNSSFEYQGPFSFSENETKVFNKFLQEHNFPSAISLHSGTQKLLLGWSYTNDITQYERPIFNSIMNDVKIYNLLPSTLKPGNFIGYTTAGEWGDYVYTEYRTIPATLEIFGSVKNDPLKLIEETDNNVTYERKFTDFEQFNPPINEFEDLHSNIYKFEKYWFELIPKISLFSIAKKKLSDGNYELNLMLRSGSKYWNTTDKPKVAISSSTSGVIKSYPEEIPTLHASMDQELKIIFNSEVPINFSLNIVIISEWAADLSLTIDINLEEFTMTNVDGFSYLTFLSVFLLLVFIVKRKVVANKISR